MPAGPSRRPHHAGHRRTTRRLDRRVERGRPGLAGPGPAVVRPTPPGHRPGNPRHQPAPDRSLEETRPGIAVAGLLIASRTPPGHRPGHPRRQATPHRPTRRSSPDSANVRTARRPPDLSRCPGGSADRSAGGRRREWSRPGAAGAGLLIASHPPPGHRPSLPRRQATPHRPARRSSPDSADFRTARCPPEPSRRPVASADRPATAPSRSPRSAHHRATAHRLDRRAVLAGSGRRPEWSRPGAAGAGLLIASRTPPNHRPHHPRRHATPHRPTRRSSAGRADVRRAGRPARLADPPAESIDHAGAAQAPRLGSAGRATAMLCGGADGTARRTVARRPGGRIDVTHRGRCAGRRTERSPPGSAGCGLGRMSHTPPDHRPRDPRRQATPDPPARRAGTSHSRVRSPRPAGSTIGAGHRASPPRPGGQADPRLPLIGGGGVPGGGGRCGVVDTDASRGRLRHHARRDTRRRGVPRRRTADHRLPEGRARRGSRGRPAQVPHDAGRTPAARNRLDT